MSFFRLSICEYLKSTDKAIRISSFSKNNEFTLKLIYSILFNTAMGLSMGFSAVTYPVHTMIKNEYSLKKHTQ